MLLEMEKPISGEKRSLNCPIHGEHEALMNGKCRKCRDEYLHNESLANWNHIINDKKREANVPARYINASFDDYIATHDIQKNIVQQLRDWDKSTNIIMLGNVGTGKTYLSIAILDTILRLGYSGYYTKFFNLPNIQINDYALYKHLQRSYLLIIDEYGRSSSDYKSSLLFELLDKRYDDMLPTIIISNLDVTKFKKNLDPAMYSRIKENCMYLNFTWEDFRLKEKNHDNCSSKT